MSDDIEARPRTAPPRTALGRAAGAIKAAAMLAGAALGAAAAVNAVIAARTPPLRATLGGTFNRFPARHGDVAYVVAGGGTPLLLLHGLGAGNSMMEWAGNFPALREHHTVYALDFLGWGLSDRPRRKISAEDCIDQVQSFTENVIGEPCAVAASSDSCAFAIEAARRAPALISRLALVCPSSVAEEAGRSRRDAAIEAVFRLPAAGQAISNLLTSRRAISDFARHQLYFDKSLVDEALVTRYHTDAHQPGARYALASFIAGSLRHDAREAWSRLAQPALLVWGRHALLNGLDTAPEWLALKPDARLEIIERAMLLPHAERPREWNELILAWLRAA